MNSGFEKHELEQLWDIANLCRGVNSFDEFHSVLIQILGGWSNIGGVLAGMGDQRAVDLGVERQALSTNISSERAQYYYVIEQLTLADTLKRFLVAHQMTLFRGAFVVDSRPSTRLTHTNWAYESLDGVTLGWRDENSDMMTFYSFLGQSALNSPNGTKMLHAVVPHLHSALVRCTTRVRNQRTVELTAREKEILQWILGGKTTWEISRILDISQRTVTYHVQNAMSKLGASTRSQAIANAARMGLLELS